MRTILALCISTFSCMLWAQESAKIGSVRFEGNQAFKRNKLEELIQLKPSNWITRYLFGRKTQYFSFEQYQQDVQNIIYFYQNEGFPDASASPLQYTLSPNEKRARITFTLSEGLPYQFDSIRFSENDSLTKQTHISLQEFKKLQYDLYAKQGKRVREEGLRDDQSLLTLILANKGYPYAAVTPILKPDTTKRKIHLTWNLMPGKEGYLDTTVITGKSSVKPSFILRQLHYRKGDPWSQNKLNESQKSIFALGAFGIVSIKANLDETQSEHIPVQIYVRDAPRVSARFGVGYGKEDRFRTFSELQFLRFPGGVSRLQLLTRYSYLEPLNLSIKFTQPAFPLRSVATQVNPYFIIQKEPAYELSRYGAELSLLQKLSNTYSSNITFYGESVNLKDFTQDANLPDEAKNAYDKFGISFGWLYTTATPTLDPIKGITISSNIKWNTPYFNVRNPFVRIIAKATSYTSLHPLLVLAAKLQIGGVGPVAGGTYVPVEELFYGGGSASVRGWERQKLGPLNAEGEPLGGQSNLEFTLEPRFKAHRLVILVAFVDGGNVWRNLNFPLDELRFASGFGVRVKTPVGPIGFDLARPIFDTQTDWVFHINIGNPF